MAALVHVLLLVAFPPLLLGVIGKTKAWFAGRVGPPLLQGYFDLVKLLSKGAVFSRTTTWIFRVGPSVSLATVLTAGSILPLASGASLLSFEGDVLAFAYLLGLGRFFTIAAALDTGSSFEGMGASRDAAFSALVEPALLLALAVVCVPAATVSFEVAFAALPWPSWGATHPELLLVVLVLFVVLLAENARVPVDDPSTHLELTMVHEVMALDHGGPDLGFILYASALKLSLFSALLVHLVVPIHLAGAWSGVAVFAAGQIGVAVLVGVVESTMARSRLVRVPQLLVAASVLAAVALVAVFFQGPS